MRFDYKIHGAGWATATVGEGASEMAMTASYLHDSLAQLVEAVLALCNGGDTAAVVFMSEPGEHHMVFQKTGGEGVAVEVRWFRDWASWGLCPDDRYEVAFGCASTLPEVREQVAAALEGVLAGRGVEGYKGQWVRHDFPSDAFERLRDA